MNRYPVVLSWMITLLIPVFLLMTAIRLLITPIYPQLEYRAPGFPPDTYGFSLDERLHWATISIDYLTNNAGIEYLADQRLADGSSLYNPRELSHMLDVKILVKQMIFAWYVIGAALIALVFWAWRSGWLVELLYGLKRGGWLAIGLIVTILVAVVLSFSALFTAFHRVFFTGDTWLFAYSDSLIRLFPMRFWQDAFILVGAFTLLGGMLAIYAGRKWLQNVR
ncbi:MAG: TIGR01906 family membrane protein [Chloroflexi bacterium]|jgi:integral membrane protein (TIGR01906 family)|nr:TIGR01906 family membrane protein [Anaerolineaceae bacterium]NMB86920.1 TIGR01906 family membrane protein [Chloroflexota bacterium]